MIDYVSGTVKSVRKNTITVDIGLLGFHLQIADSTHFHVDQKVNLYAHMHWNQENGPTLFGFSSELEKEVFLLVIGCSGIGPKIGLAVLRDLGPERFLEAIQTNDDRALSSVGGLGPKKVEQMVVQLKAKVAKFVKSGVQMKGASKFVDWQNVSDVLVSLKYSRPEVTRAMKFLSEHHGGQNLPFDSLVRHALSFLAKKS